MRCSDEGEDLCRQCPLGALWWGGRCEAECLWQCAWGRGRLLRGETRGPSLFLLGLRHVELEKAQPSDHGCCRQRSCTALLSVCSVLSSVPGALELATRTGGGTLMITPCNKCSPSRRLRLPAPCSLFLGGGLSRANTTLSYYCRSSVGPDICPGASLLPAPLCVTES